MKLYVCTALVTDSMQPWREIPWDSETQTDVIGVELATEVHCDAVHNKLLSKSFLSERNDEIVLGKYFVHGCNGLD